VARVKKTTLLFPPDLFDQLARMAQQRHTSVAALAELASLSLPAGSPEELERESVPVVEPLP
jgi:hypothetical protein